MLNIIEHGSASGVPLLIVHGLYGSARNWGVIAKRLADQRHVIAVDLRNHGESDWAAPHTYPAMAEDLRAVVQHFGGRADMIGHSMGGKAAMVLALQTPQMLRRLVVADIAPVAYSHSQMQYIDAMRAVDLARVTKRADAMAQLADHVDDPVLQSFFTQSLDVAGKRWRLNLDQLAQNMADILSFPEVSGQFANPTLFLTGAQSEYVLPEHRPTIRALFPKARFAKLQGAGHWLHAEKPREFEASVRAFLAASDD
ncbi:alpha/beta fold hydrolase [Primorskyibacter sp. S187A]|uniref:alpha/beta fold hydrolase n=1 Tax=Primorskyibacter sp. S187A TaxID=3415130 RepID=UPI003C7E766E